ncbi:MAG: hypothetical protein IKP97_02905 [Kiritimatiellae bacterium]|nr:hypothetical protein [Kiritimatiellia bacterium]
MSKTVFLGVEGSGKTTLTVALARAFESHKEEGWYLKPLSRDSFRFLKTLPDTLDGDFPSQTADLRELRWQAEYKGNDLGEIAILDYPGEIYRLAFLDEKDERDPEAFRQKVASNKPEIDALLGAIKEAEDVFVLFNLADGMDLRNNLRNLDAVWVTNECLKLLKRLESKPRIRLLFTQVDRYRDAGLDLSTFSPKSIDLIGHDHSDVPWCLVSVVDRADSEYGVDKIIIEQLVEVGKQETRYILGNHPLRHLQNKICLAAPKHSSVLSRCLTSLVMSVCLSGIAILSYHSYRKFEQASPHYRHSTESCLKDGGEMDYDWCNKHCDKWWEYHYKADAYATAASCLGLVIIFWAVILLSRHINRSLVCKALNLFYNEQWIPAMRISNTNNPYIQYYRGIVLLLGLDGKKVKVDKARELLLLAMPYCQAEVKIALGYMAEHGIGQPANLQLSRILYTEANKLIEARDI